MIKDKYFEINFKIDGPTFQFPESRENPQLLVLYLGKTCVENMKSTDGKVENMLMMKLLRIRAGP